MSRKRHCLIQIAAGKECALGCFAILKMKMIGIFSLFAMMLLTAAHNLKCHMSSHTECGGKNDDKYIQFNLNLCQNSGSQKRMRTDQKEAAVDNIHTNHEHTHAESETTEQKKGSDEKSDGFKINN